MSKSRGNVANPFDAMDTFGVDAIRWYLIRIGGGFVNDAGECHILKIPYGAMTMGLKRLERGRNHQALH